MDNPRLHGVHEGGIHVAEQITQHWDNRESP
jgi:hypothetical protein